MKHWILVASTIFTGLYIAKVTHQTGLRQFAAGIAITGTIGWILIGFEQWIAGIALLAICCALFMKSRILMEKHGIGPFCEQNTAKEKIRNNFDKSAKDATNGKNVVANLPETNINKAWIEHAYPLQQMIIKLQGTRHSDKNDIIDQLEIVLDVTSRIRCDDDHKKSIT